MPYAKRLKTRNQSIDPQEQEFHNSNKPRWTLADTLLYAIPGNTPKLDNGILLNFDEAVVGEHKDYRFAKFAQLSNVSKQLTNFRAHTNPSQQLAPSIHALKQVSDISATESDVEQVVFDPTVLPSFTDVATHVSSHAPSANEERYVWQLAGILFDEISDEDLKNRAELAVRKDKLSDFFKKLVRKDAENQIHRAASAEERALIWLTCGDVEEACAALLEGKNFHLATMVAQLPGNDGFQEAIAQQLAEWRRLNALSEFDDNIRIIYELLAGNVCESEAKTGAGRENEIATISFSKRLNLDWRRAFGLRLWYGSGVTSIEEAVKQLEEDMQSGAEPVRPVPWFVKQQIDTNWEDPTPLERQDVLWGLLKLFATSYAQIEDVKITETSLAAVLEPSNVVGNPLDARLSLELFVLLSARGIASHDSEGNEHDFMATNDALVLTYAEAISSLIKDDARDLDTTVWALMQLSDPYAREQRVRSLLSVHAPLLNPTEAPIKWLQTSAAASKWEFAAKALYARAIERDSIAECRWLVHAGEWTNAHSVLCGVIGPTAVIEMDDNDLRSTLTLLRDDENIDSAEWSRGGEIYLDYIELLDLESQQQGKANISRVKDLVQKLGKALEGARKGGLEGKGFKERVALQMMAEKVAKIGLRDDVGLDKKVISGLPLTGGVVNNTMRELALGYYRRLMDREH